MDTEARDARIAAVFGTARTAGAPSQTIKLSQLMRLLQLASPALPVGGYSYSQGLEAAVDAKRVKDRATAIQWISDLLQRFVARSEAPTVLLAGRALQRGDDAALGDLNDWYYASRETAAARAETKQMGWSLLKLATELQWPSASQGELLDKLNEPVYPVMYGSLAAILDLDEDQGLSGYLFAWLENQIIALQKLLAVGQSAGQAMLFELAATIPQICVQAAERADLGLEGVETFAPQLGLLAARHETQYSRIFRS